MIHQGKSRTIKDLTTGMGAYSFPTQDDAWGINRLQDILDCEGA